jgi:uncharacterized cupredoxin-like copper-binding protein
VRPFLPLTLAAAVAVLCLLGGCSADRSTRSPAGTIVHISERDFHITAPATVRAGRVRLVVKNNGPDAHELIVIRARDPKLPLRGDGTTVDEEDLAPETLDSLEPGPPGSTRELDVMLKPGTYELICNMTGHFMGGMESVLRVR